MNELEQELRTQMGDDDFEACYRSCFGRLRADRPMGDFPLHSVVLRMVQCLVIIQNGGEPNFIPYGGPGVPTPEPDSLRIIEGRRPSPPKNLKSEVTPSNANSSSGCYIATAVYGSYNCQQLWTLRRYRDHTLAKTWYGRLFIHTYYAISPSIVKWLGETLWFKCMWQRQLDKFVKHLQSAGIADTPYEDKIW